MERVYCEKCGREIFRLEAYISVESVVICEECYMNMSTVEFLERLGGKIKVVE